MPTICPHCHAVRAEGAQAPAWQCPSCSKAYAKAGAALPAGKRPSVAAAGGLPWFKLLLVLAICYALWAVFQQASRTDLATAPVDQSSSSALVDAKPIQSDASVRTPFDFRNYQITPLAKFSVRARVLSVASYRTGREADLSPVDLALGWGNMANPQVAKALNIRQSNRFYFYSWPDTPPLPPQEIIESSANMHFVPATDAVEAQLKKVREGDVVDLSGYLIRADASDGWHWVSSLTRQDSGAGACELVWVETLTIR